MGLGGNTQCVLDCLKEMLSIESGGEICLDFSEVEFIYPNALAILASLGFYLHSSLKCKVRQINPLRPEVNNFLKDSGFSEIVGLKLECNQSVPQHNGTYIFKMKFFEFLDDYEIEKIIDIIEKELSLSRDIRSYIHENLAELILNVQQHSKSPFGCLAIAQGYPQTHRIRFCICDAGIGIKNHLGKKYTDLINKNSVYAIKKALEQGVTGTTGNQNSGVGLPNFKEFIDFIGGEFIILSGNGYYEENVKYDNSKNPDRKISKRELDFEFPGTLVSATIKSEQGWAVISPTEQIPDNYKVIR